MSVDHSRKLIKEIADRREADAYFEELLKDPAWREDMERAEAKAATQGKWDALMKDTNIITSEPDPSRETEIER